MINTLFNLISDLTVWAAKRQPVPHFVKDVDEWSTLSGSHPVAYGRNRIGAVREDQGLMLYRFGLRQDTYHSPTRSDYPHSTLYVTIQRVLPLGEGREAVISEHKSQVGTVQKMTGQELVAACQSYFDNWDKDDQYVADLIRLCYPHLPETHFVEEAEKRAVAPANAQVRPA